jgi:hypothetical protein
MEHMKYLDQLINAEHVGTAGPEDEEIDEEVVSVSIE